MKEFDKSIGAMLTQSDIEIPLTRTSQVYHREKSKQTKGFEVSCFLPKEIRIDKNKIVEILQNKVTIESD